MTLTTAHHSLRDTVQYIPHEGAHPVSARVVGVSYGVNRYDLITDAGKREVNVPADAIARGEEG